MDYIIRDHDKQKFEEKKAYITRVADYLNQKYGQGTIELILKDSYYNMKEKIEPHMYLIDLAKEAMTDMGITRWYLRSVAELTARGFPIWVFHVQTCVPVVITIMADLSMCACSLWRRSWSCC